MDINDNKIQKKLQEISLIYKALSDPTRLKIIVLLAQFKKMCVNAIAQRIGISQPAISQQLKILKTANIIEAEKVGLYVHYYMNDEIIDKIISDVNNLFKNESAQKCIKCPE